MKAIQIKQYGGEEQLKMADVPRPRRRECRRHRAGR